MKVQFWLFGALATATAALAADAPGSGSPTFSKDVLPILQRNCQSCHRPGQIAPMSFLTYQEARPWAKAIKSAVSTKDAAKRMPPWFADARYGHFSNDRTLQQTDIETLVKWVDAGAPEGNPHDSPGAISWPAEGWRIKPDVIVEGVQYHVPKAGILPWLYVRVPMPFKEDTWVTSMEMRPGANPGITHHYCIFLVPHHDGDKYGEFTTGASAQITGGAPFEGCYEKGQEEFDYRPQHAGQLIPGNMDLIFQMHYAPNGQEGDDHPQIGFTVTKERPAKQYVFATVGSGTRLNIPPGEANYKAPAQEGELAVDGQLVWLQGHAHYRAKELKFNLMYPDGRDETELLIHWNPLWQTVYYPDKPMSLPKGTRFHIEGVYDNSPNNPFNPDPTAWVRFGEQYTDEMLFPTFGIVVDGSIDVTKTRIVRPPSGVGRDFTLTDSPVAAAAK